MATTDIQTKRHRLKTLTYWWVDRLNRTFFTTKWYFFGSCDWWNDHFGRDKMRFLGSTKPNETLDCTLYQLVHWIYTSCPRCRRCACLGLCYVFACCCCFAIIASHRIVQSLNRILSYYFAFLHTFLHSTSDLLTKYEYRFCSYVFWPIIKAHIFIYFHPPAATHTFLLPSSCFQQEFRYQNKNEMKEPLWMSDVFISLLINIIIK